MHAQQNSISTEVKPLTEVRALTFMCFLSGILFGREDYYCHKKDVSHLHPSVITQLFLFEMHSHGSKVFFFLTNRFEQQSSLTRLTTWCTHISITISIGFGKPFWNIPLLVFPGPTSGPRYTSSYCTWQRRSNWPHLLPTTPTSSHWEVSSKIGPGTVIT